MRGLDWIGKILRSPEEIREREKRDILRRESEIDKDKELRVAGLKSKQDILIIDDEIDNRKDVWGERAKWMKSPTGNGRPHVFFGEYGMEDETVFEALFERRGKKPS